MMKVLWILRKNCRLTVADGKGLLFSFLLPVVLAVVTGLAFSGSRSRPISKIKLHVVAEDDHETVRRLVKALAASDSLELAESKDLKASRELVQKRKILAVIHFPPGCGAKLANGFFTAEKARIGVLIDPSRQVERGVLQGVLSREMMRVLADSMTDPDRARAMLQMGRFGVQMDRDMPAGVKEKWDRALSSGVRMFEQMKEAEEADREAGGDGDFRSNFSEPFQLAVEPVTGGRGKTFNMFAQTFSGTGVMFLLFGVMGAASNLVQERERGTLRRILTTPTRRVEILVGEAVYYFLFSLSQLFVLFAVGKLFFGIPFHGSKAGLLLIAGSTAAAVTGFGILVAAVGRTERQVQGVSVLVILVMSAIGGSMFPVWLMPEFMQVLADVTINKWAVMGFEGATWRGLGFADILWPNATVLLGMAVAFFGLGVARFRWE